jgi:hypothetical protein
MASGCSSTNCCKAGKFSTFILAQLKTAVRHFSRFFEMCVSVGDRKYRLWLKNYLGEYEPKLSIINVLI